MANVKSIFNEFDYEAKGLGLKLADFCNQGIYTLFKGKRIKLYQDRYGDEQYTLLKPRSFILAMLITAVALPLLIVTLPIKLLSKEQIRLQANFKHLVRQKEFRTKQKPKWAARKIQRAFKDYSKRKKVKEEAAIKIQRTFRQYAQRKRDKEAAAATKIQRAFRNYLTIKKAKEEENKWFNKARNYIKPYVPYVQKQAVQLAGLGVRSFQQMAVNLFCDALTMQACAALGVDPSDVKLAIQTEKTLDRFRF